jgi:hypothetical protein
MPKIDRRFIALGDGPHELNLELLPDGSTRFALTTDLQNIDGTKIFNDIPKTYEIPSEDEDITNKSYVDNRIEQMLSGSHWQRPVNTVSYSLPTTTVEGYRVLNLSDNRIYTFKEGNWDTGVIPSRNWTVLVIDTDEQWTYDSDNNEWIVISFGGMPEATKDSYGKVQIGNGLNVIDGIVSVNASYGLSLSGLTPNQTVGINHDTSLFVIEDKVGIHPKPNSGIAVDNEGVYVDYSDLAIEKYETFIVDNNILINKFIDLSYVIKQDNFTKVQVIGGPLLQYDIDFTVTVDTFGVTRRIDWNGYNLDGMLELGETIQVWYITI